MLVALAVAVLGVAVTMVLAGTADARRPPGDAAIVLPPVPAPPLASGVVAAPTAPVAAPLSAAQRARCPVRSVACVDLVAHEAWLQRGGAVTLGPVPILPGTDTGLRPPGPTSSATPAGSFHVLRKKADEFSEEFREPMPDAVYFAPRGIAFHAGSLTETSNGCVHLDPLASRAFFDGLRVGDGVTVF